MWKDEVRLCRKSLYCHLVVGSFPSLLSPQRKPGNVGQVYAESLGSLRPPGAAEGTPTWRAPKTGTESGWRPAGQTQRGPGPTCGQHF